MFCYWSHSSGLLSTKVYSRIQSSGNSGMKSLTAPKTQSWHAGKLCFPYHPRHDPRSVPKTNLILFKRSAVPISDSFESHWCLVCAVVSFCLSLTSFPTKAHNTGLFKGHSLFASWLLLRQMFQGTTEDINTCILGDKKGVQVFKQCQMWKNSNSLPSPLIWQFQGTKRVTTCTQSTFRSGEFRQGLH